MGLPRAAQLAVLGNSVVPDQAAIAWCLLWAVHAGDVDLSPLRFVESHSQPTLL